jgi:hypothetical protein
LCEPGILAAQSYSSIAGIMLGMVAFGILADVIGRNSVGILTSFLIIVGVSVMAFINAKAQSPEPCAKGLESALNWFEDNTTSHVDNYPQKTEKREVNDVLNILKDLHNPPSRQIIWEDSNYGWLRE